MKICDQCRAVIFHENAPCPRCFEEKRLALQALAPKPVQPKWLKIAKWLLIGLLVAVLAAAAGITWLLNSLGPMPSFG